jgi:hypothetical protein
MCALTSLSPLPSAGCALISTSGRPCEPNWCAWLSSPFRGAPSREAWAVRGAWCRGVARVPGHDAQDQKGVPVDPGTLNSSKPGLRDSALTSSSSGAWPVLCVLPYPHWYTGDMRGGQIPPPYHGVPVPSSRGAPVRCPMSDVRPWRWRLAPCHLPCLAMRYHAGGACAWEMPAVPAQRGGRGWLVRLDAHGAKCQVPTRAHAHMRPRPHARAQPRASRRCR